MEEDFQALEQALICQLVGFRPWRSLAGSGLLHTLAVSLYMSVTLLPHSPAQGVRLHTARAIPLFAPGKSDPPQPGHRSGSVLFSSFTARPLSAPSPDLPDVKVDLSAVRLSFAPDVRNELPQVVQDQHGMLALLDKEDRTVAHYLVQPPAWDMEERIQDVSRNLLILMDPPEKWVAFQNLAKRYGIDLSRYQACAVFDLGFRHCLKDAILARASMRPEHSGSVISAKLAIAAAQPCGIEVLEVSFAAN